MLKQLMNHEQGTSDLLNYAHFVDDGVILNKDGAFLCAFQYQGPDIHSASSNEVNALTHAINRMSLLLDDGWMVHVDTIRMPSIHYPEPGNFPDSVSALIDDERRVHYEAEGAHFENLQIISFVWKFPLTLSRKIKFLFVENLPETSDQESLSHLLQKFHDTVERCLNQLSLQLKLKPLTHADLLAFLNTCISGELAPVAVPPQHAFLDVVLGRKEFIGGYIPRIGDKHIYPLSFIGYMEKETIPGLLEELDTYPLVYRWSNRFIPLSHETAEREIKRYQRDWHNKVRGFWGTVKSALFGQQAGRIDHDALMMEKETEEAMMANRNQRTRFGYLTSTLILMHEDESLLQLAAKDLAKYCQQKGFSIIKETVNAVEAWRGSIPGHGHFNITRLFATAENFSHMVPFHTIWTGAPLSSRNSLLPPNSPPVFYAATTGKTPFRFHCDVEDVGHQLIIGPTGAGKSTYVDYLIAQFYRYEKAKVFLFDKDYSHHALTTALDGIHYDIGHAALAFCPLEKLETDAQRLRAAHFIETLVELQNITLTPDIRSAIYSAIQALAEPSQSGNRSLTTFQAQVQHKEVRAALNFYTLGHGMFTLLDATHDALQHHQHLHTFEMNWLLAQKPELYIPVLFHIFNTIENYLEDNKGKYPTLIPFEECWYFLSHGMVKHKIKDFLKTLRKFNARLILPSQSLADLYNPATKSLSDITATLLESCPTKIFLPHQQIDKTIYELYQLIGLSERQIEIIGQATPKRHYYVVTPEGHRLIELGFTQPSVALAFLGLSKEKTEALNSLKKAHPQDWIARWLMQHNLTEWATYWEENYELKNNTKNGETTYAN